MSQVEKLAGFITVDPEGIVNFDNDIFVEQDKKSLLMLI